jgi:putative transposase
VARPLRVQWEGCWYHVTSRGNERKPIYRDEEDRFHFLGLLSEMTERFRTRLHVYTLMDNHYHLLLETLEANLMQAMQWFNSNYSGWFNRRHHRSGHLLQARYKAIVVEPERWGLELSRYVHLNPIRVKGFDLDKPTQRRNRVGVGRELGAEEWKARIDYLRSYRWSSYRAYTGLEATPSWLTCGEILKGMGVGREAQQKAYREYVESAAREGLEQIPWDQLQAQVALGEEEFLRRVEESSRGNEQEQPSARGLRKRVEFSEVIQVVEKMKGECWQQFVDRRGDWGRDMVLSLARQHCGMTLSELAEKIEAEKYSAIGKAIARFEERANSDAKLRALLQKAKSALSYVQA